MKNIIITPESFNKTDVKLRENEIVGVSASRNGALQAPIWGYEIQFSKQQDSELKVQKIKAEFQSELSELGIRVAPAHIGKQTKKSNRKVRHTPESRWQMTASQNKKGVLKTIKNDIKAAMAMYQATAGTPVAQVYWDELQMLKKQKQDLLAA
jgi:hypothetical protein